MDVVWLGGSHAHEPERAVAVLHEERLVEADGTIGSVRNVEA